MSKKRKTKKEKLIAALRRQNQIIRSPQNIQDQQSKVESNEPKYTFTQSPKIESKPDTYQGKNYSHVYKDAQQTILITALIIALNAALFMALQNNLISLSIFGL